MAVVVDPVRCDLHHRRQEWRGPEQQLVTGGNSCHQPSPLFDSDPLTPYISFARVGLTPGGNRLGITITNHLKRPEPQALAGALEALAARFGNPLITSQAVRDQRAHTTTWLAPQPPVGGGSGA